MASRIRLRILEERILCEKCSRATVARRGNGERMIACAAFKRLIPPDVVECDAYMPFGTWPPVPWPHEAAPLILDLRDAPGQAL